MVRIRNVLVALLAGIIMMLPINVFAGMQEEYNTFWLTAITTKSQEELFFKDVYDEPKTLYTTTYLNMRRFPNTSSKVDKVLPTNSEVTAIADFCGWTKIIKENDLGMEKEYYVWNEFLSEEKIVTTKNNKGTTSKSNYSEDKGYSNDVEYSNSSGEYLGNFKLTAYCNCSKCCGKWAGGPTASGAMPVAGRTVAMGGISFGTKLLINGNVYTVEDRGTPYGHVDIYFNSHSEALQFGLRYADVYRVN